MQTEENRGEEAARGGSLESEWVPENQAIPFLRGSARLLGVVVAVFSLIMFVGETFREPRAPSTFANKKKQQVRGMMASGKSLAELRAMGLSDDEIRAAVGGEAVGEFSAGVTGNTGKPGSDADALKLPAEIRKKQMDAEPASGDAALQAGAKRALGFPVLPMVVFGGYAIGMFLALKWERAGTMLGGVSAALLFFVLLWIAWAKAGSRSHEQPEVLAVACIIVGLVYFGPVALYILCWWLENRRKRYSAG